MTEPPPPAAHAVTPTAAPSAPDPIALMTPRQARAWLKVLALLAQDNGGLFVMKQGDAVTYWETRPAGMDRGNGGTVDR